MIGSLVFFAAALLVLAGGLLVRYRLRRSKRRQQLTDDMVRRIEREGTIRYEPEEPLDLETIRKEEDAFWERTWDEPEEW